MHPLSELQQWYQSQCNGEWEHSHGIKVDTLDNPGWRICVDLSETALAHKDFTEVKVDSETKWMLCRVCDRKFEGFGSPLMLEEILGVFLRWAA